jgi:imidazolonepropionase-like amidohydrolase
VDATGQYAIPGLIDMHVHILTPFDAPLYPAAGVTTVRNMWGFPSHLQMRSAVEAGRMFGPRIVTAGRLIDGDPKIWPQSLAPQSRDEVAQIVAEDIESGYDFVKVYSRVSRAMFDDIAELAKEKGVEFAGHVPGAVDIRHAASQGMRSIEHLWGFPNVLHPTEDFVPYDALDRSQWDNVDLGKVDEIADVLKANDVWVTPTLLVLQHIYMAGSPELLRAKVEGVEFVSPATIQFWEAGAGSRDPVTAETQAWIEETVKLRSAIVKRLYDNGVRLLVGSDANNPYVVHGFGLYHEMEMFVEAGIPLELVLELATHDAAEYLGRLDSIGTIDVGKNADIVLLNNDPRLSVENLKDRRAVIFKGVYHPVEELLQLLEENREAAANFADRMPGNIERHEAH